MTKKQKESEDEFIVEVNKHGIKTISIKKQTCVAFISSSGCNSKKVADHSLDRLKVPNSALAFFFCDLLEVNITYDDDQVEQCFVKKTNISPLYYYRAILLSREDVVNHKNMKKKSKRNVLEMMDRFGLKQVIQDRFGSIDPYDENGGIVVIAPAK